MNNDYNLLEEVLLDRQFLEDDWSDDLRSGGMLNPKKMYAVLREMEKLNNVKL